MMDAAGEAAPLVMSRTGPVAVLTLNAPERLNALSIAMRELLAQHVPQLVDDPTCRVILITGAGRAYCSGGAMNESRDLRASATRTRMAAAHQSWIRRLLASDTLVVSAVNGPAAGAGFGLAMLADFVLVSPDAYFKAGFPAMGAAPDYGLGWTLPRAVGAMRAREILMTNRKVEAAEAERIGMITRIVEADRLMEEAMAFCQTLAGGPYSLGLAKTMVRKAFDVGIDEFLELEAFSQGLAFASEDFQAGRDAFQAKQKPRFSGL